MADASKYKGTALGAYVGKISPGSAAERLGLEPGDIITEMNGRSIVNADDLATALSKLEKGSSISLGFMRDDRTINADGVL